MTLKRIAGPAGFLSVDDGGTGSVPVVFVHSFAGTAAQWSAQLAQARRARRAVALNLRGHGQSERPANGDYSVESLATDIAAVVDGLELERFMLVGHSLGAAAAIAYAGAHPERVAGLLLVGAPGKIPENQARQIMTAMESDYDNVSAGYWNRLLAGARPQVEEQVRGEMSSVPREAALRIIRATFQFDPLPALNAYPGPKVAIVTPHGEMPDALHHLVSDLPHKVITGTSHWPHMDKPEGFNRTLVEFLATTDSPGAYPAPASTD